MVHEERKGETVFYRGKEVNKIGRVGFYPSNTFERSWRTLNIHGNDTSFKSIERSREDKDKG